MKKALVILEKVFTNEIVKYFLYWKTSILLIAFASAFIIPLRPTFVFYPDLSLINFSYFIWVWANFDGKHYLTIADLGYQTNLQPFFPLFPLVMHLVGSLLRIPGLFSGIIVNNIAFLLTLYIAVSLLIYDGKKRLKYLFLAIIFLYPTSFFYGAVYTDAFFFFFATFAIFLARKNHWALSGIVSGFATLTRLNGLALFFYILLEYLGRDLDLKHTWHVRYMLKAIYEQISIKKIIRSKIYLALLIPLSFLGYLLYIHIVFKDWRIIFSTMEIWKQNNIISPPQVLWRYIKIIFNPDFYQVSYWVAVLELSFVILYLCMLTFSIKKIRFSYWFFFAISILIPGLTGTFQGMPRYGLHLYPLFLSIALFLEKKHWLFKIIILIFALTLSITYIALFTRGYFIA